MCIFRKHLGGKLMFFSVIKFKENHGRKKITYFKLYYFFFPYGLLFLVFQDSLSLNKSVGEVFLANYPIAAVPSYLLSISNH